MVESPSSRMVGSCSAILSAGGMIDMFMATVAIILFLSIYHFHAMHIIMVWVDEDAPKRRKKNMEQTLEERINNMENKMKNMESILRDIRNSLTCGTKDSALSSTGKKEFGDSKNEVRWNELSPVERTKILDILDSFDFKRVHDVMEHLNWTWVNEGVPSETVLRTRAYELLVDAAYEETTIATGGFKATWEEGSDDGIPFILLEFILTDCEGFVDDEDDDGEDEDQAPWARGGAAE